MQYDKKYQKTKPLNFEETIIHTTGVTQKLQWQVQNFQEDKNKNIKGRKLEDLLWGYFAVFYQRHALVCIRAELWEY